MGTNFQIKISGNSSVGAVSSAQAGGTAEGVVNVGASTEHSLVALTQTLSSKDGKITLEQGAVVGAVSMAPGVPAQGVVTISADRLPKQPEPGTEVSPLPKERFRCGAGCRRPLDRAGRGGGGGRRDRAGFALSVARSGGRRHLPPQAPAI